MKKERKARAPDLTDERIEEILEIVDGWRGKLTWDLLLKSVEEKTGILYSRFTLAEYPQLAEAFSAMKDSLRGTLPRPRGETQDPRVRAVEDKADRLAKKVERLERENRALVEQFVVWVANAHRHNVSMDELNKPLPKPERDRNKGRT